MLCRFRAIVFLVCWLLVSQGLQHQRISILFNGKTYMLSCLNAQIFENSQQFCDFATWTSALLYESLGANFTYFSPSAPLTVPQQNEYARLLFNTLGSKDKDKSGECGSALRRLSCVTAFPKCATTGTSLSSISYYQPCRLQCMQVNARCSTVSLDCSLYQDKDCFLYVPPGFFSLPPTQGPYNALPVLYSVCLALWLVLTLLWIYWAFVVHRDTSLLLCRAVAGVPVIKCIVLVFGTAFWSTCVSWELCSFWMSVSLVNTHLVFETAQIVLFLLIAKGWRVTRDSFPAADWRLIVMTSSAFYMANSIIAVLQGGVLNGRGYWSASAIIYGLVYIMIFFDTLQQLRALSAQLGLLPPPALAPPALAAPLRKKYLMYQCFLGLAMISAGMEVLAHALVAEGGKIWLVLVAYETSNLLILGTLGWIFRPREHSPFFYMVPVGGHGRMPGENGQPNIPFLEMMPGDDEDQGDHSYLSSLIELAPLIQNTPGAVSTAIGGTVPQQLILITEPTNEPSRMYSVGCR